MGFFAGSATRVLTTCCTTYYNIYMLKTYLYIPDHLEEMIVRTAETQKKSKAEVMRKALQEGLEVLEKKSTGGAEVLLKLADTAKKYKLKGPKDASVNHDYYLWGLPKKQSKVQP